MVLIGPVLEKSKLCVDSCDVRVEYCQRILETHKVSLATIKHLVRDWVVATEVDHHDVIPTPTYQNKFSAPSLGKRIATNQLQTESMRYEFHILTCSRGTLNMTMNGRGRLSSGATCQRSYQYDTGDRQSHKRRTPK